jgi:hypothetical protein
MRTLKQRSDCHGEMLAAGVTLMQTGTMRLPFQFLDVLGQNGPSGQRKASRCFLAFVSLVNMGLVMSAVMVISP